MQSLKTLLSYLVVTVLVVGCATSSEMSSTSTKESQKASTDATKTIAEQTKNSISKDGFFTVYRDTTDGSAKLLIDEDQLDNEFIYFTYVENGTVQAGRFRGQFRENAILKVRRNYDRIEFVKVNNNFYFDPDNAISKASEANISDAVLASQKILAEDKKDGKILINADELFLKETLHEVKGPSYPGQPPTAFSLGRLSSEKTKYRSISSYPQNTDWVVEYVFDSERPLNGGGDDVTDARAVTIVLQHSFIEMPKNGYQPRMADPRVGYFTTQIDNLTSTSHTPYRDLIQRWNLEKKNPDAELSEPVEPITWWIENTTPEEFRPAIREGVLAWNKAFEKAGFKNAVVVKQMPDTASWDAGDLRYNVLRWTSSPYPPFGGYGPSFVNPNTGEIIGADIMLEYVYFTNRVKTSELWEASDAMRRMQANNAQMCAAGYQMYQNLLMGRAALDYRDASEEELGEYVHAALVELTLHEVGHTLGLSHNMKASNLHSVDEINNEELTSKVGLTGSVMDYNAANLALKKEQQGDYFQRITGPYDDWAIEFGYDPEREGDARTELLNRSTEDALAFGNDADDMRSPGKAIDPEVMTGDLTSEAIEFAKVRMELVRDIMPNIKERFREQGESHQKLYDKFTTLFSNYANSGRVMSRYVGGVYVDRGFVGQPDAEQPYTPVSLERQKKAMNYLGNYVFAPNAWEAPNDLYNYLQRQRRGFNFFGSSEDPKIHAMVLSMQQSVLDHLLHPNTVERITNTELYGNEYSLSAFMNDLTSAIFDADMQGNVNTFRQNLQLDYVNRLTGVLSEEGQEEYDYIVQSQVLYQLNEIKDNLESKNSGNQSTRAHTQHLLKVINTALDLD
ncbi:MAG: zinc-dependent metalloprotease [Fodinibius sp.]|nr:zinc-dependent metalloprotease [Fodinibius sp.]